MKVIPYSFEYYPIMCKWLEQRGQIAPDENSIPKIGLVAVTDEMPVAMVFLRIAEGSYAIIEGLASNPDAVWKGRDEGLNTIIKQIIQVAKNKKIKEIISFTVNKSALTRAIKAGMTVLPHVFVGLDLTSKRKGS